MNGFRILKSTCVYCRFKKKKKIFYSSEEPLKEFHGNYSKTKSIKKYCFQIAPSITSKRTRKLNECLKNDQDNNKKF